MQSDAPINDVYDVLKDSLLALRKIRARFERPGVREGLLKGLHDPEKLPDRRLASCASQVIDTLHETETLLQPGHLVLADHFLGYVSTKCLVAAVRMNVPDVLAASPKTLPALAGACGAREDRFRQIMRVLYNNGIFTYDADKDLYSNNHRSELLRTNHWTGWHNWVELYGNQFYDMSRGIPDSVAKDATRSAAQYAFDTDQDMFTYFEGQGWLPQLHRTLGAGAIAQAPGIVADYPWSEVGNETVIDIGGGGGALIASLLRGNPNMKGGVYDLSSVINHIQPFFQPGGQYEDVGDRVDPKNLIAGNFFESIPANGVYVMKWCLHDWLDDDATTILKNIRKSIQPGEKSRLIVLESILSDGESGRLSRYGDINMMITAKGQERPEGQWRSLAKAAGWTIAGIHPMRNTWVAAIDLRP